MEQASTGPKGKVKTEALKKEREAQVSLVFHIYSQGQGFARGIFPVIFIVDNISKSRTLQDAAEYEDWWFEDDVGSSNSGYYILQVGTAWKVSRCEEENSAGGSYTQGEI